MRQLRGTTRKCWQNLRQELCALFGVREEPITQTITATEMPETEHLLESETTKGLTAISAGSSHGKPLVELFSNLKEKFTTFAETPPTKTETLLLGLPQELLDYIFSYLPAANKACLALASKDPYQLYNPVFAANELRFPTRSMLTGLENRYILTEAYNQRMSLLVQLENRRWACCARCRKLHPRNEFPWSQLRMHSPYERICMTCAGIVDVCPCIVLTIRNRKHIGRYLNGRVRNNVDKVKQTMTTVQLMRKGLVKDSWDARGEPSLVHERDAYAAARVDIELCVSESEQLLVCALYGTFCD